MQQSSSFYFKKPEPVSSCLLTLRDMILAAHKDINETVKYGMPCFCLGTRAVCYLWTDKKTEEPYILFVDGNKLVHPMLESGKRKRMKTLTVPASQNIDRELVKQLLDDMLSLYA